MNISPLVIAITLGVTGLASAQQASTAKPNLLVNGSFEDGQAKWEFSSKRGIATVDTAEKRDGKNSISIENPAGEDSYLKQAVALKPRTRYRGIVGYYLPISDCCAWRMIASASSTRR